MSAKNRELISIMKTIQEELKSVKTVVMELKNDSALNKELISMIHFRVSDLSCKVDESCSTINLVTSKNTKTKSISKSVSTKKKLNIMSYFKVKYKEDPEKFKNIFTQKDVDSLYEKFASEINSRKKGTVSSYKISLIYKEIIKKDKNKIKMLRNLKEKEEEEEQNNDEELVINNIEIGTVKSS